MDKDYKEKIRKLLALAESPCAGMGGTDCGAFQRRQTTPGKEQLYVLRFAGYELFLWGNRNAVHDIRWVCYRRQQRHHGRKAS